MPSTGFDRERGTAGSCRLVAVGVAMTGLLAACGSSSSESSPAAGGDTGQASAASCQDNLDINAGFGKLFSTIPMDGPPDAPPSDAVKQQIKDGFQANIAKPLASILSHPPQPIEGEIKEVVGQIQKTLGATGDPSAFNDPVLQKKTHKIDLFFYDNCPGPRQAVIASEYGYGGLSDKVSAGAVNLKLHNSGKEEHEILILTRKPGVTESFDDILKLPKEQGKAKTEALGQISAHPGEEDATAVKLDPGKYIAICTVSKGSTADKPGDGPPHFTLGMKREFTVE